MGLAGVITPIVLVVGLLIGCIDFRVRSSPS